MNKLSMTTCTAALNGAAMSRRSAFQIELAVGLAVFMIGEGVNKDTKAELCAAYANAGYQCMSPDDLDYKTVNRRLNVTADLFNTLTLRRVRNWAGQHDERQLLDALIEGLQPYELYNVSDVQRYCEPPQPKNAANDDAHVVAVKPDTNILRGPAGVSGQQTVINMFRRAADQLEREGRKIQTQHLALIVPATIDRDELVEMAMQVLALADQLKRTELQAA